MDKQSFLRTIVVFLLLICILIASVVVLNGINKALPNFDNNSGNGSSGDNEPDDSFLAYYSPSGIGPISFDFSTDGVLIEDDLVKVYAKNGYLVYGNKTAWSEELGSVRNLVFPLNKDGSEIKISDYSSIEISFDIIYGISEETASWFKDGYNSPYEVTAAVDTWLAFDSAGTPILGYDRIYYQFFGEERDEADGSFYYMNKYGEPIIPVNETYEADRSLTVNWKIDVDKDNPRNSVLHTTVTRNSDGYVIERSTNSGYELPGDTIYGITIRPLIIYDCEYINAFDNFNCILTK